MVSFNFWKGHGGGVDVPRRGDTVLHFELRVLAYAVWGEDTVDVVIRGLDVLSYLGDTITVFVSKEGTALGVVIAMMCAVVFIF